MDAALAMSMAAGGADVRTAGELSAYGHLHIDGRQAATAARAHAVLTEQTVLVAFGLGKARDALARLQSVAALSADQVVGGGRRRTQAGGHGAWVGVLAAQLTSRGRGHGGCGHRTPLKPSTAWGCPWAGWTAPPRPVLDLTWQTGGIRPTAPPQ